VGVELPADALILAAAALLAAGVLGAGFADRLRIPGALLFLVLGMAIGDDGLALVRFSDPLFAQAAGSVALLLIIYGGGLTTAPVDLRRAAGPGMLLATVGVLVTAGVVAAGAWLLLDVDALTALLIGAVVSSTDAAAVFTVLRRAPLPRRLVALLEVESGANDPAAIILTIGLLEAWRSSPSVLDWVVFGVVQLGGGAAAGALVGVAGSWLLNRARLGAVGLYPVLALAVGGLSYGLAAAGGASPFLAVYVTGLIVGARVPRHRRSIHTFHDGLANTAEIGLFLLLGVFVFPSQLPQLIPSALAITGILVLIARPAAVVLCLAWSSFSARELTLVSWAGLRGAVPIVLATFPITATHPDGALIFNLVFFVVLVSVAVQGVSVGGLGRRLGLEAETAPWAAVVDALPLEGVDADLIEVAVTPDLPIAGHPIREVPLPHGALLTAVVRGGRTSVPTAATRLQPGDLLLVTVSRRPHAADDIAGWAHGAVSGARPPPAPDARRDDPAAERP